MAAYTDFTYYSGTFLGNAIAQADFPRLALRASEAIDQMTFDRTAPVVTTATDTATIDKVKMAVCAVAEVIQQLEVSGGAIQSESIGRASVTYISKLSDDARVKKAAKKYLASTSLMYSGFNKGEGGEEEHHHSGLDWFFHL